MTVVGECRTCAFLAVPPNKAGVVIPRKDQGYMCVVEVPEPDLPASMTGRANGIKWPPPRTWMCPGMGVGCPCWEKRGTAAHYTA